MLSDFLFQFQSGIDSVYGIGVAAYIGEAMEAFYNR